MAALGSLSLSVKNARFWLVSDSPDAVRAVAVNVSAIAFVRIVANHERREFFLQYETFAGVVFGKAYDSLEEAAAERDAFLEFASATSQPDERSAKDLADPNEPAEPGQGESTSSGSAS